MHARIRCTHATIYGMWRSAMNSLGTRNLMHYELNNGHLGYRCIRSASGFRCCKHTPPTDRPTYTEKRPDAGRALNIKQINTVVHIGLHRMSDRLTNNIIFSLRAKIHYAADSEWYRDPTQLAPTCTARRRHVAHEKKQNTTVNNIAAGKASVDSMTIWPRWTDYVYLHIYIYIYIYIYILYSYLQHRHCPTEKHPQANSNHNSTLTLKCRNLYSGSDSRNPYYSASLVLNS